MSISQERRIIRDKIEVLGVRSAIEKAISETEELLKGLRCLLAEWELGNVTDSTVINIGEEMQDVQITVKDTLFRIWTDMRQAYQAKRRRAFTEQIPQAIAEVQTMLTEDEES